MGLSEDGLLRLVRAHKELLDSLFGEGSYQIDPDERTPDVVYVRTNWMELLLAYDFRDQFISSSIRPLRVPDDISEHRTTDTLLRFLDIEVGLRRQSTLDEQQIRDELNLIEPLVTLLKDHEKSRDATLFVNGYSAAYTDYCSGKW